MYFLSIHKNRFELLGNLRHLDHLQLAYENDLIWLKGFIDEEINASIIRKIPNTQVYYENHGWLHKLGSQLRERRLPNLLFTPIQRAIPIEIEHYNHNLFEVNGELKMQLTPANIEHKAFAQLVNAKQLINYTATQPNFRFKHLHWCLVNNNPLIIGWPPLPINGTAFWLKHKILIPLGYNLNFPLFAELYQNKLLNGASGYLMLLENEHFIIENTSLKTLSRSSIYQTLKTNR
ncbi:MAG: hypothetical protein ACPGLV_17820 [Bacteroidia bacterium]